MGVLLVLLVVLPAAAAAALFFTLWWRNRSELNTRSKELTRFQSIRDLESYVAQGQKRAYELHAYSQRLEAHIQEVESQIVILDDQLELQHYGVYEPQFNYDDPERYKAAIKHARDRQKALVKSKVAAFGGENWTVDGSEVKGRQMVDRQKKLMLRAFNGECDAAIAKVKHGNAQAMATRVQKSAVAINKLGDRLRVCLSDEYVQEKLRELHLTHERQLRLQELKEEQREIREQMREEQKAEKERRKAIEEAEREEARQELALDQARAELARASAAQQANWQQKIAELEAALDATKRKKSQAELTKTGHIYVISNVGSFGENIYKIGMTRRLQPEDRVRELGDASVPFRFDVHAMIATKDAPQLENELHKHFDGRRLNKVNRRREFFRVSLDEVEQALSHLTSQAHELVRTHAAEEYRETLAMDSQAQAHAVAAATGQPLRRPRYSSAPPPPAPPPG